MMTKPFFLTGKDAATHEVTRNNQQKDRPKAVFSVALMEF
jgi:hypothetical protein